jgi:uncharacterized protein (DUF433 family)
MVQSTEHCYIVRNDEILSGKPIIQGTRTPVRAIVEMWRLGVSPEEISQRLSHLKLSQVFDALSYWIINRNCNRIISGSSQNDPMPSRLRSAPESL